MCKICGEEEDEEVEGEGERRNTATLGPASRHSVHGYSERGRDGGVVIFINVSRGFIMIFKAKLYE